MPIKFQRNYILSVQGKSGELHQIRYPLTLEFSVVRFAFASMNTGSFRIYNLNQQNRGNIYRNKTDFEDIRSLKLQAGYASDDPLPIIFNGNVSEAYSCRNSGDVNFITQIQGYDFNFPVVNSYSSFTKAPPTTPEVTRQSVVNELVDNLINSTPDGSLKRGVIGTYDGAYARGRTICGNTWDALKQETGRTCFIDSGRVFCLPDDETYEGDIKIIDASTGLLSTPKRRETYLDIEIIFEPSIEMGQQIYLRSESSPQFNGYYKVLGIQHQGTISGAVAGKCTTILTLNYGARILDSIVQEGILG